MKKSRIQMLKVKGILAFSLITTLILTLVPAPPAGAMTHVEQPEQVMEVSAKALDKRAVVLKDYLAEHNSPLEDHAQDFIDAADYYGVDWKLVPAIAGVESTFGKAIPGGYNGWGWGVYGDQAIYFRSWKDGIFTVTQGLKQNYINKGLTNPYSINRVYAASPAWGGHVAYFMNDIDRFSKNKTWVLEPRIGLNIISLKEAGNSATLLN